MPKKCSYSILLPIARLSKLISLILLLVFSSLQVAQSLHIHNNIPLAIQNGSGHSVQKYTAGCLICDYLLHKQATPADLTPVLVLNYFSSTPVILDTPHLQLLRAASVLAWTNKGPPSTHLS